MKFGIGKKLLVYFLVLSLVPLIVGGGISYYVTKSQLQENTKAHLSDRARDCGRKISYYVGSRYQDIRLLSLADVLEGNDTDAKRRYIEEVLKAYPFYEAISVIDLKGTIIACTRKELIGHSRADSTWFQRTIQRKQGEVIPLDAYRAETAGQRMVIGFNTPITDERNKQVIGVLTTRVSMDHIIERVRVLDERSAGGNHAYLLNKRGEILAGPDEKEFLKIHRLYEFPVVKDLLTGKTGITEYKNDRGQNVISARYALKGDANFNGWGWGIIVTEPVSEAFKAAYIIRNTMITSVIIITFLVTIFAIFISKRFSRPIKEVSKSALQVAQGDLKPIKITYGSNDEIGNLVGAFNKMTEDLHATTVSRDSLVKEIAERKRAEEMLRETRDYLENLFNYANAPIIVWDQAFRITRFNHAFERLTGYTAEEVIGQELRILFPEASRDKSLSKIARTLSGEYWESVEIPILCRDGDTRVALWNSANIYAENGTTIIATIAQGNDITERKRAEEALRKSEDKLKNILHGSPIPTFVIDSNHRVTYWNRALEEYSGIKAKDIVGTNQQWKAFYNEERPCMADLLVDGKTDDIPQWYPGKYTASDLIQGAYEAIDFFPQLSHDGKWLYFTAAPLKDSNGRLIGVVEILQDITETKKAEEQIRLLSRQNIEIQERERESLSREVHDNIGQLLSALKMGLSRTNKKIPNELSTIKDQLSELSYLVNKTIQETRELSHALHPPLIEDLGLVSALEELCQDFKSYSEIKIKWNIEQIQKPLQSITNITIYRLFQEGLNNILKHSRATEAYLSLTFSEITINAIIEDNGVGFLVDNVFSPLQHTKSLGLISMRERLALIGGELKIISSPGKGTRLIAHLEKE